ncbi:MAG: hypothetical protein E6I36_03745 [Chloroflexi bacterium]|nr:MAG: hypothetical protein E6I36_03745 [Chloroflexota bacterium]
MTRRIILDCDPGHDDAMAILLAHGTPEVSLAAITTVAGNHPLALTTLNALRVCTLAGIHDVLVAAGCAAPLVRPLFTAEDIHGKGGLEGHEWGEPSVRPVPEHAVDVIVDIVMSAPGEITLVPIGPLTNIAMRQRRRRCPGAPRRPGCRLAPAPGPAHRRMRRPPRSHRRPRRGAGRRESRGGLRRGPSPPRPASPRGLSLRPGVPGRRGRRLRAR